MDLGIVVEVEVAVVGVEVEVEAAVEGGAGVGAAAVVTATVAAGCHTYRFLGAISHELSGLVFGWGKVGVALAGVVRIDN